jgi:hypothetical protein
VRIYTKRIIFFLVISVGAAHGFGMDFSLKVAGGVSFFDPQEVNTVLQSWEEYWTARADSTQTWTYLGGEVSKLKMGYDFEAELILNFTPRFAIGLSGGYIFSDVSEKSTALTIEKVLGTFDHVKPTKISAIPLILSGYYLQPLTPSLSAFLRAGGGPLWAKYFERDGNKKIEDESYSYSESISASAQGQIYILSLGVVLETESGIRFFMEGMWRKATITGFSGENKQEETGALIYVEEYEQSYELWQAKYGIFAEPPSSENYREAKQGTIDLSGFSVKVGIMIKF